MKKYTEQMFVSKEELSMIMKHRIACLPARILEVAAIFERAIIQNEWEDESLEGFKCFSEKHMLGFDEPEEYFIIIKLINIARERVL